MDTKRRPLGYYAEAKSEDFVIVHDETNPRVAHDNYVEEDIVGPNGVIEYTDVQKASERLRQIYVFPMDSKPRDVVRAGKAFDRFAAARISLDEVRKGLGSRLSAEREQGIHNARKEWQDARAVLRWAIFSLTKPEEAADVETRTYAMDVWNQPWEELKMDNNDIEMTLADPYTGSGSKAPGYGAKILSYMSLAGELTCERVIRDIGKQLGYR